MTTGLAPLHRWEYGHLTMPEPCGPHRSYELAAAWMDFFGWTVQDWGCGTAYAKQFFKRASYVGVDGSPSTWTDIVHDLRLPLTPLNGVDAHRPEGILIRHCLEHIEDWQIVLENALDAAQDRLCLVLAVPLAAYVTRTVAIAGNGAPDISFFPDDLIIPIHRAGFSVSLGVVPTRSQYNQETLFYCDRRPQ